MTSRLKLTLMWLRVAFFSALFFASFTASLYLPHSNAWWRVSMMSLVGFSVWSVVNSYRRRKARREQQV